MDVTCLMIQFPLAQPDVSQVGVRVNESRIRGATREIVCHTFQELPPGLLERSGKNDPFAADQQGLDPGVLSVPGVDRAAENQHVSRGTRAENRQQDAPQAELNFHRRRLIESREQRERRLGLRTFAPLMK